MTRAVSTDQLAVVDMGHFRACCIESLTAGSPFRPYIGTVVQGPQRRGDGKQHDVDCRGALAPGLVSGKGFIYSHFRVICAFTHIQHEQGKLSSNVMTDLRPRI